MLLQYYRATQVCPSMFYMRLGIGSIQRAASLYALHQAFGLKQPSNFLHWYGRALVQPNKRLPSPNRPLQPLVSQHKLTLLQDI